MKGIAEISTTIIGILILPYSAWLMYSKESFGATDFLIIVIAASFLIWFKSNAAKEVIDKIIDWRTGNNEKDNSNTNSNIRP